MKLVLEALFVSFLIAVLFIASKFKYDEALEFKE